jgi:hypothetical protein
MTDNLLNPELDKPQDDIDPNKNYLPEMLEKFKTPEAIALGKARADNYIKILERRLDETRDDYIKERESNLSKARLEELINQLSAKQSSSEEPPAKDEPQPFDPKQIESLVSSQIQAHEMSRQQTQNFKMVEDRLRERYGSNYKTHLRNQIDDLGITEQELNEMARKQPKVLLRTLGADKPPERDPYQNIPTSSQRSTDTFTPTSTQKRTWSYYEDLKKKDPKVWLDRKTAIQMAKDAEQLGDAFMDGNFYVKGLHEK